MKQVKAVPIKKCFPLSQQPQNILRQQPIPSMKGSNDSWRENRLYIHFYWLAIFDSQKATQYRRVRKGRKILRNIGEKIQFFTAFVRHCDVELYFRFGRTQG